MHKALNNQVVSVGAAAGKLPTTALVGRKYVMIQNLGGVTVYLGSATVTADTANTGGFQLLPRATMTYKYTHNVDVYGIIATGSTQVLVEEGK